MTTLKTPLPLAGDAPREVRGICRKLRTKHAFGTLEGLAFDWREGRSSTAAYWCLRTMEPWGPDDRPAEPLACREGRCCHAATDAEAIA